MQGCCIYHHAMVLYFSPVVVLYFPEQISESSLLDRSGVSLESKPFIGVALFKSPRLTGPWKGGSLLSLPICLQCTTMIRLQGMKCVS